MHIKPIVLLFLVCGISACNDNSYRTETIEQLKEDFITPPQSAKPMVWWHWMNGNINTVGLREDILWMYRSGIGGFHVFDANLKTPLMVDHRVDYMSDEWKAAFSGAIALADSLGMDVAIASSPGYSSTGGPWVEPKDAMKKITWRSVLLNGGNTYDIALPEPFTVSSRFQDVPLPYEPNHHSDGPISEWFYDDIAVYAVKLPDSFRTLEELGAEACASDGKAYSVAELTDGILTGQGKVACGEDGYVWMQYEFQQPVSFKAVTVVNGKARSGGHGRPATCLDSLLISNDGIHFTTLCGITVGAAQQQTEIIPEASARFWRLKRPNPKSSYHYGNLVEEAKPYVEIAEFVLHSHIPFNHFEEKAGFATPCDLDIYTTPEDAPASEVIDITGCFKDGHLNWTAPEGRWMVYRFGTSLTGKKNHPSSPEATGLEVDKLDKNAYSNYLHHYLDMYKEASAGLLGERGIQYLLIDSYESGSQNWTATLPREFRLRRGYDMMPWLPAIAGVIIKSAERTDRFLWDFRRTIGELFAENYDNASRICAKDYGMRGVFAESHEHGRNCLADGISVKKTAAYPMSAMWIQSRMGGSRTRATEGLADIRESASTAHIYGQNLVAAESFTAAGTSAQAYSYCPENLKRTADLEMSAGVNRFVIHESAHQPSDDKIPGMGMSIYGQWFNRHETWAEQASAWTAYLARSCSMLQKGRYSADLLYYYGEDSNVTAQFSRKKPDIPFGYGFDFIGADALRKEIKAKNGLLESKSGMKYTALYVGGEGKRMSYEVRACIEKLKKRGIMVVEGGPPSGALDGVAPDLVLSVTDSMLFYHRIHPAADIYWIANQAYSERNVEASFRISGRKPMKWHPETGEISDLPYRFENGRTVIPLAFSQGEAFFVVFAEKTSEEELSLPVSKVAETVIVPGPWHVAFQTNRGAPESVWFNDLEDWRESKNTGIKYFSGTAAYSTSFVAHPSAKTYELDLGEVYNLADVKLNGISLGILWRAPFRADVTGVLKEGTNELVVSVTNLWVNRLIGDEQPGIKKRITYTTFPFYKADDQLMPSGLVGPVRIIAYETQDKYSEFPNPIFAEMMDRKPILAALNHCPYNAVVDRIVESPAPKGYIPFYLSHYGRHGSRSAGSFRAYERLFPVLASADSAKCLTGEGKILFAQLKEIIRETNGMAGRLTVNGQNEHAQIAERTFRRFPQIFSGRKKIDVLSSEVPRCLVSMAAFTNKLKGLNGKMDITFDCGSEIQKIMMNNCNSEIRPVVASRIDSLRNNRDVDFSSLPLKYISDAKMASDLIPDAHKFAADVYSTASIAGAFNPESDMLSLLPLDIRYALAEEENIKIYLQQCNSKDYGTDRMARTVALAKDIADCADNALAGNGVSANLRFGHDWPLLALCSRIGIEGVGDIMNLDEARKEFITTLYAPFAGNLQIIFYTSSTEDMPVLVKCLLNERECLINGLNSDYAPYYRWSDLRARLIPN